MFTHLCLKFTLDVRFFDHVHLWPCPLVTGSDCDHVLLTVYVRGSYLCTFVTVYVCYSVRSWQCTFVTLYVFTVYMTMYVTCRQERESTNILAILACRTKKIENLALWNLALHLHLRLCKTFMFEVYIWCKIFETMSVRDTQGWPSCWERESTNILAIFVRSCL